MRAITRALLLIAILLPVATWSQEERRGAAKQPIMLEDFEKGVGRWRANDDLAGGAKPASKCRIYAMSEGAPYGGKRSARVEFSAASSGWASVSLPVNGEAWPEGGWTLSLWLRGDGSNETVRVVLRVQTASPQRDEAYWQTISLDGTKWEKFSLRSFGFKNAEGQALKLSDTPYIKLLQFSKAGGWRACRFRVDELRVLPEKTTEAEPPAPPTNVRRELIDIRPDFATQGVPALAQIGFNLGRPPTVLESQDQDALAWADAVASDLAPCLVRMQLADYYNPAYETYNLDLLREHMRWARRANCRPLVCVSMPRVQDADQDKLARISAGFVKAVSQLASAVAKEATGTYYEIFDEPLISGAFADVAHMAVSYNKLAELIVAADPSAKVGGPGFASAWDKRIEEFLRRAERLDFLSFHFYGAHSVLADSKTLFAAAMATKSSDLEEQMSFRDVRRIAQAVRGKRLEVFVTEFALSSARDKYGASTDERVGTAFGAAWLAAATVCAAPHVDKLIHFKLAGGGWGLLADNGTPEPPYWAVWLLRNYAPRGSYRQQVFFLGEYAVAASFKTRTAYNLVIAYGGPERAAFRVRPRGLPPLGQVRYRRITDAERQWTGRTLSTTRDQDLVLDGPGVLVLQYVPK